jgi:hypothetical protein
VAHSEGYASTTSQVTSSEDADGDWEWGLLDAILNGSN